MLRYILTCFSDNYIRHLCIVSRLCLRELEEKNCRQKKISSFLCHCSVHVKGDLSGFFKTIEMNKNCSTRSFVTEQYLLRTIRSSWVGLRSLSREKQRICGRILQTRRSSGRLSFILFLLLASAQDASMETPECLSIGSGSVHCPLQEILVVFLPHTIH